MSERGTTDAPARRSLRSGAAVIGVLRAAAVGAAGLTSVALARILGPVDSGRVAASLALFFLLCRVVTLGVDLGIAWAVSAREWEPRSSFATSQVAALGLGLATGLLGMAAYLVLPERVFGSVSALDLLPVLLAVPAWAAWTFTGQIAVALDRYEANAAFTGVQALASLAAVSALAAAGGIGGALCGVLVGQCAAAVVGIAWARRSLGPPGALDLARLRRAMGFGVKPYLANMVTALKYRVDLLVLSATAPRASVGYYAVAVALSGLLPLLPGALGAVLFPRMASFTTAGDAEGAARDAVETKALRHTALMLGTGAVLLALIVLFLLEPVYGRDFAPAREPGLILIPGGVAVGVAAIVYASLAGRGRPDLALRGTLTTTPPTIVAYLIVVPRAGGVGAAIVSSAAYAAAAGVSLFFLRRETGRPVLPRFVPGRAELRDYRRLFAPGS